jgi:hypothetical protein
VSFIVVFAPFLIFAEDCPANQICNPLKYDSFPAFLDALLTGLIWLAIYIAPIILVIAGFYFATAMGDPKKIDLAKKMVLYTLIGFAVVYASKILVSVIANAVKDSIKVP